MSDKETVFEITFITAGAEISTRMGRQAAIEWLRSENLTRIVSSPTGVSTPIEDTDDAELAKALAAATLRYVKGIKTGMLNVRENDQESSFVALRTEAILGVRAIPDFDLDLPDARFGNPWSETDPVIH